MTSRPVRHGTLLLSVVAGLLIAAGAGILLGGPPLTQPESTPVMAAEIVAHWRVAEMTRDLPVAIAGPRFVVGDSLAWWWPTEPRVFALSNATSAEVRAAVLQLPRAGRVNELIVWLGSDEVRTGRTPESLVEDVAAIIEYVQPAAYVVVAPLPSWTSARSLEVQPGVVRALTDRFHDRVVNPYTTLRGALYVRAPVYYDDFQLTMAGYDHVQNQVEISLGYNRPTLSFAHGVAQYGRMMSPVPAGLLVGGESQDG